MCEGFVLIRDSNILGLEILQKKDLILEAFKFLRC